MGTTVRGRAWIQVFVDGQPVNAGKIYANGDRTVVVARKTVVVNTGVEKSTVVGVGRRCRKPARAARRSCRLALREGQGAAAAAVSQHDTTRTEVGRQPDGGVDREVLEPTLATTDELIRLAAVVGRRLNDLGATMSTAESCTGGLVGHS